MIIFYIVVKLNYLLYLFSKLLKLEKLVVLTDVFVKYFEVFWFNVNERNFFRVLKVFLLKIRISKG